MSAKFFFHVGVLGIGLIANAWAGNNGVNLPPPAELVFQVKSSPKGIPLSGEAKMSWQTRDTAAGNKTYKISSETSVSLFGKILSSSSVGSIDEHGLLPEIFTEKRLRKAEESTRFDRSAKKIHFAEDSSEEALKGGEQDRLSAIWQLIGLVRELSATPNKGKEWKMTVAGLRDSDPWIFQVLDSGKIVTALGELDAVHILRAPPSDAQGQQLEIWLAPSLDYYPVRISFHDSNGDKVDQRITSIKK